MEGRAQAYNSPERPQAPESRLLASKRRNAISEEDAEYFKDDDPA